MKRIFLISLFVLMLSCISCYADTINITINNEPVQFTETTGTPFIANNRTLVPMRVVMEQYGCTVDWDKASQTAIISKDNITIHVPIGKAYITVNGQTVPNDSEAQIVGNRTYLPIRVVLENVGANVDWDKTKGVTVTNKQLDTEVNAVNVDEHTANNFTPQTSKITYQDFVSHFDIQPISRPYSRYLYLHGDFSTLSQGVDYLISIPQDTLNEYCNQIMVDYFDGQNQYNIIMFYNHINDLNDSNEVLRSVIGTCEKSISKSIYESNADKYFVTDLQNTQLLWKTYPKDIYQLIHNN